MPLDNHLHIIAGYKNEKTFLKHAFSRQPFKLADITENKADVGLQLMITSSSPGIMDNDNYTIEMEIEAHAKVFITTQGYQRLFTMANNASQCTNVYLKNESSFCFLPHPSVPHTCSNFSSINNIYLGLHHNLVWSDIITCGRKLSGEIFKFSRYHNVTNIYLDNKLVVRENVLMEPLIRNVHMLGQLEGYTHQSTLLFINDEAGMEKISAGCFEILSPFKEITFGISMLPVNGLMIRILGHKGEQLFDCNKKMASFIRESVELVPT